MGKALSTLGIESNIVVLCYIVQEHMDDLCVKTYEFQRVEK